MTNKQILEVIKKTSNAKSALLGLSDAAIKDILEDIAVQISENSSKILEENEKDLHNFKKTHGEAHPNYDRLLLNKARVESITNDLRAVINFDFSVDENLLSKKETNGLTIKKVSSPFGAICVIYESRPNVTVDVFSLCFRSQNVCILKGGEEAFHSNQIFVSIIKKILTKHSIPSDAINLLTLSKQDAKQIKYLLGLNKLIDLCIPRGGKNLINFVKKYSKIPVIETGAGVVHLYLDEEFDEKIAKDVIFNSKTRRVSVCNALDCLLVHKKALGSLSRTLKDLASKNVTLYCDAQAFNALNGTYPFLEKLSKSDIGKEFLDYKMSVITVNGTEQALRYISKYSSNHSDGIISSIAKNQILFKKNVDSSAVYINTSTAFTDGSQFGLGSEIGISTQKMHARGPMGIESLRTVKYIIFSEGKTRA